MKIEAVIVCQNYSDYLEHTLPHNMQYLDKVVVVTHPSDHRTRALCSKYSVDCVTTTAMNDHGDAFNKGRCINLGLGHTKGLDWLLHLDADILLPHDFKNMLHRAHLQTQNLYGADRMNVYGYDHFVNHRNKLVPHYSSGYFVESPREFNLGARIIHHEHGYCPIGYFQLWHKSQGKKYPITQGTAEHTDVLFACQWDRMHRVLLPEILVYHLDSHSCPMPMGENWHGRKSPPFKHCEPEPPCKPHYKPKDCK